MCLSAALLTYGLHLSPHEYEMVASILRRHLPGRRVWAFGPRANGIRLKRFSDLDLAVGGSLTLKAHGLLADDFDESPLPIKVDVLALDQIDAVFRERIARDFILIRV